MSRNGKYAALVNSQVFADTVDDELEAARPPLVARSSLSSNGSGSPRKSARNTATLVDTSTTPAVTKTTKIADSEEEALNEKARLMRDVSERINGVKFMNRKRHNKNVLVAFAAFETVLDAINRAS